MEDEMLESQFQMAPLLFGYVPSRIVTAAVRLGVPDTLANGPKPVSEIAVELACHQDSMRRLLRSLVVLGIVEQPRPEVFGLSDFGRYLAADVAGSMGAHAVMAGSPEMWKAWGGVEEAVRTGREAFKTVNGKGLFDHLRENTEEMKDFQGVMARNTAMILPAIVSGLDFSRERVVVDVGGGNGTHLSGILQANPNLRGVLFDLPGAIAQARVVLAEAGVADRCEVKEGDFFSAIPESEGVFILKNTLNDWDDEASTTIIRNCRKALGDRPGKLLIIAAPVPEGDLSEEHANSVIADFEMLITTGGRERSVKEYEQLLTACGFRLAEVIPLDFPQYAVIEATPV